MIIADNNRVNSKISECEVATCTQVCSSCHSCNCDSDGSCWGKCKCFDMSGANIPTVKEIYKNQ